jgi:hypothetical protein
MKQMGDLGQARPFLLLLLLLLKPTSGFCVSWRSVLNTTFPQSFNFDFVIQASRGPKGYFQVSILRELQKFVPH